MNSATVASLAKWRHLIEPEISSGLTPVSWDQFVAMPKRLFEAANSVVITRDTVMSGVPVRSIWIAAGVLCEVEPLVQQVEESAIADGIRRVVFMGRRGWIRAMPGYREMAVIGVKEF